MQFTCELVNGTPRVKLDISDLKLEGKEKLEPYLYFNCSTFKNVREFAEDPDAVSHIFASPNWVMQTVPMEQKIVIAQFFASVNYTIKEQIPKIKSPKDFLAFTEQLGQSYYEMAEQIKLLQLFRNYAATKITLQDTSTFGTRPQDTEELTFREPEMREVMVVAMFCKMASPIFGELINNLPGVSGDSGKAKLPKYKESRCSCLLNSVLSAYFKGDDATGTPGLIDKLMGYIHHIVNSLCAKNQDPAMIFHGLTPDTRTSIILSSLLVRNYVLCELEKSESNIIRYTDTMVRTLVQTQDTNAHKSQVRPRKAPGSMMSGDDAGNMAQIEVDSLVSMGTMDGPVIIESQIDRIVQKYRCIYEITKSEFDSCMAYFAEHPIYPTPLNKLAICIAFANDLGGGRGVDEIGAVAYTKLAALLQLMSFASGYVALAVALTAEKTNNVRLLLTPNEDRFKRQVPTLSHYRTCRARFAAGDADEVAHDLRKSIRESEFDRQMDELINDLATTIYVNSVPDIILDIVPEDSDRPLSDAVHNGDTLIPSTEITEQLCMMITRFTDDDV